ncbi:MAG: nucleotide exchange factor GrpE [Verrucomicrobiota bacterium]|nr:nucleotide exchange factor GrpE [Verrucomicrobiota bacterium]
MKFWNMGKDKDKATEEPEMTSLEKRLVEKAALEENEEEVHSGPKNLKEAQAQIDELDERLLRLTAEYDNFRKRSQREKNESRQFANQHLLEKQLPVLDNFEMALTAAENADPAIRDGVQMIYDQFLSVLKEAGVEGIDAGGELFDPNIHEAISQKETTEVEEGTVVQQVQRGYKLNDRLVRPARVIVAKAPESVSESADE